MVKTDEKMVAREKVFCCNCKYYSESTRVGEEYERCLAPENCKDSWKEPRSVLRCEPSFINNNNDCDFYVEHPNKILIK